MTRVEDGFSPVAPCEMSSQVANSKLAVDVSNAPDSVREHARSNVTYWRIVAVCVICFGVPCDAWYSSPFNNNFEVSGALDRCESYGMGGTYGNCSDLNGVHISDWDVGNVHDMSGVFYNGCWNYCISTRHFNADISRWDVSSVTRMDYMFYNAQNFTGDLSNWDVSSVTYMG